MKHAAILTMTITAIAAAMIVFIVGCGTDRVPTTLEADPKTGEVTVKGDKGDRGEVGPQGPKGDMGPEGQKGDSGASGPKGDTGAPGKDGKDGEAANPAIWKDPLTGKLWIGIHRLASFTEAPPLCVSPWKLPTYAELRAGSANGVGRFLPVDAPSATGDLAWTTNDTGATGTAFGVSHPTNASFIGDFQQVAKTTALRVYCTRD